MRPSQQVEGHPDKQKLVRRRSRTAKSKRRDIVRLACGCRIRQPGTSRRAMVVAFLGGDTVATMMRSSAQAGIGSPIQRSSVQPTLRARRYLQQTRGEISYLRSLPALEHHHIVCALVRLGIGGPVHSHIAAHLGERRPFVLFHPLFQLLAHPPEVAWPMLE